MKKLLFIGLLGLSVNGYAVTCGENQEPDPTNSYCEDVVSADGSYVSVEALIKDIYSSNPQGFMSENCRDLYNIWVGRYMETLDKRRQCGIKCQLKGFKPFGLKQTPLDKDVKILSEEIAKSDPEFSQPGIYNALFHKICETPKGLKTVTLLYEEIAKHHFNNDPNKLAEKFRQHYNW